MGGAASNVHELNIPPKTIQERYRKYAITVTFLPAEKVWRWSFHVVSTREIMGTADTMQRALAEAKKKIDRI